MVGERIKPPADRSSKDPQPSFDHVSQHLGAAKEFAAVYFSAQAGRIRVLLQNAILFAVLGAILLIIVTTFAVMAVALLCNGAAGGIGALLGGRTWAGELIVGAIVLGGAAAASLGLVSYFRKLSRHRTISGYLKNKVPK